MNIHRFYAYLNGFRLTQITGPGVGDILNEVVDFNDPFLYL